MNSLSGLISGFIVRENIFSPISFNSGPLYFRIISAAAIPLLSLLISGCIDYSRKSGNFNAPGNCRWESAHVEIEHKSAHVRGSDMGPRHISAYNIHTLVLKGINPLKFRLAGDPGPGDYNLRFAPDCRALAVSGDRGLHSSLVFLDSSLPFMCKHMEIDSSNPDFWQSVPSTKEVVLEILRSSTDARFTRGKNHALGYDYGQISRQYGSELLGGLTYAVDHADDRDLRHALFEFMMLPGEQGHLHQAYIMKEMPGIIGRYEDIKKLALDKLGEPGSGLIASVLAAHPDTGFQGLIAGKLGEVYRLPASDGNCSRISDLTAALVLKTAYMKRGDFETVSILRKILNDPKCPLRLVPPTPSDYREAWSIRGEITRINSLKGLAASGNGDAMKTVADVARGTCYTYQRITMGASDEVKKNEGSFIYNLSIEPDKIVGAWVGTHNREDIACYAQALLKMTKK